MLVERSVQVMNIAVVGEAYEIAANFLRKTGLIAQTSEVNAALLETVYRLFDSGVRNRLLLANKAISRFESGKA